MMASKAQKNVSSPLLQLHSFYTNLLFTCFDQIDLRSVPSTCHKLSLEPTLLSVWNVLCISNLLPSSFSIRLRCHLLRGLPQITPSISFNNFPSAQIKCIIINTFIFLLLPPECKFHESKNNKYLLYNSVHSAGLWYE